MTHHVFFHADRAFLKFAQRTLAATGEVDLEDGAACALAIAAALEASVNAMFVSDGRLPHYDELKIHSKIETLATWANVAADWGVRPWQDVAELIRVRNWLAHFKESYLGLTSLSEGWVANKPKIDPFVHLGRAKLQRYLDSTKSLLTLLNGSDEFFKEDASIELL